MPDIEKMRAVVANLPRKIRGRVMARDGVLFFPLNSIDEIILDSVIEAARAGIGVAIEPKKPLSLSDALPLLREVRFLYLFGNDRAKYRDWLALEECIEAHEMDLPFDPTEPVDFQHLPRLTVFRVYGPNSASAASNPSLKRLTVDRWLPQGTLIPAPLTELQIVHPWAAGLSFMQDPSRLETLSISNTESFDLATILPARELDYLRLSRVDQVLNAFDLVRMPRLKWLSLIDIQRMPRAEVVEQLDLSWFELTANRVLPEEVRARLIGRPGWTISPYRDPGAREAPLFQADPLDDGRWELTFDEWSLLTSSLVPDPDKERFLEDLVRVAATRRPAIEYLLDSEGDAFRIQVADESVAKALASRLQQAWDEREPGERPRPA